MPANAPPIPFGEVTDSRQVALSVFCVSLTQHDLYPIRPRGVHGMRVLTNGAPTHPIRLQGVPAIPTMGSDESRHTTCIFVFAVYMYHDLFLPKLPHALPNVATHFTEGKMHVS